MTVDESRAVLREHPFFEGMDPSALEALADCTSAAVFRPGDFLAREGQPADRFYVIEDGRVAIEVFPPMGGPITIETMDAGDVLGWSWLFTPHRWHFDARAVTRVRAVAFDAAQVRSRSAESPALALDLLRRFAQVVVQRLEATQLQLTDMYVSRP